MPPIKMTAQWVARVPLPAKGRREDWFDTGARQAGGTLGLRVDASGTKSWFVMYRLPGDPRKRRHTFARYPATGLADARQLAMAFILAARGGQGPGGVRLAASQPMTFEALVPAYIDGYARGTASEPRKRSWKRDEALLRRHVLPAWRHRKIHEITRADVHALLGQLEHRGLEIQLNRIISVARMAFRWALERDYVQTNPFEHVRPPLKERSRTRTLAPSELKLVWKAFDALPSDVAAGFKLLLLTAQRRTEVFGMAWSEVDLDAGQWTLPGARTKNKREHVVFLSEPAVAILRALHGRSGHQPWVFPSPIPSLAQPVTSVQKHAKRLRAIAGVGGFVLHDFRRTAATLMENCKVPREVIGRVLNHTAQGVTAVYARGTFEEEKRQAMAVLAAELAQITGMAPVLHLLAGGQLPHHVPGATAKACVIPLRSRRPRGH